jgi:DNA-binding GntR family transcriptional regulator
MKRRAYDALKQLLVSGPVVPGTFLSERQLARQLGMSNTPVRAALGRLEAEGFIAISPQQGIVVRELSVQEIIDHYELRDALEPYVIRKIAGRLSAEQVALLRANLDAQRRSLEKRLFDENVVLDGEFHGLFCTFLGNEQISRAMLQLRDKIHRAIVCVAKRDPSRMAESYREHRDIAEAAIAGKAERAAKLMIEHIDKGRSRLLSPARRLA